MIAIFDNFAAAPLTYFPLFYRPGNYNLTDKFLGGTNARKSAFPKGLILFFLPFSQIIVKSQNMKFLRKILFNFTPSICWDYDFYFHIYQCKRGSPLHFSQFTSQHLIISLDPILSHTFIFILYFFFHNIRNRPTCSNRDGAWSWVLQTIGKYGKTITVH